MARSNARRHRTAAVILGLVVLTAGPLPQSALAADSRDQVRDDCMGEGIYWEAEKAYGCDYLDSDDTDGEITFNIVCTKSTDACEAARTAPLPGRHTSKE